VIGLIADERIKADGIWSMTDRRGCFALFSYRLMTQAEAIHP
jgi:hypothetical protein